MFGVAQGGGRRILAGTLKIVAVTGLLTYGLGAWLSRGGLETGPVSRVIADLRGADDPITTGSIGQTRLDPCMVLRP
jgi:hypothetical protein